jgi:hypothetical protein
METPPFAHNDHFAVTERPTRTHRATRRQRAVLAAAVAVNATALAGLAYLHSVPVWARARAEAREAATPVNSATATASPSTATPAPGAAPKDARAATPEKVATLASASAAAAAPATSAPPPSALLVPDFKGKRLSEARREGKKLGLVITARDEDGERVPADMARYYRVRRQLTTAGTPVDSGAAVELRVRETEPAAGY